VQIAMGNGHACATLADRSIRCWGLNTAGQLGIGEIFSNYPSGLIDPAVVPLAAAPNQ